MRSPSVPPKSTTSGLLTYAQRELFYAKIKGENRVSHTKAEEEKHQRSETEFE